MERTGQRGGEEGLPGRQVTLLPSVGGRPLETDGCRSRNRRTYSGHVGLPLRQCHREAAAEMGVAQRYRARRGCRRSLCALDGLGDYTLLRMEVLAYHARASLLTGSARR